MNCGYPKWISHDEMPIWSIDAQPNGFRLLTAGGDNNIKVWNILPIISSKFEIGEGDDEDDQNAKEKVHVQYLESLFDKEEQKSEKLLATLNRHTSPVNVVRWNKLGTVFASGSDDGTIYIWHYRGLKKGSFQNSDKIEEDWTTAKPLRGHNDNIFQVSWSPDSEHLISCGVDGKIYVWNIFQSNPIEVLQAHEKYVNGVVFDPFNRYFISQSTMEKKIIVWKIHDKFSKFTKEKEVSEPYLSNKSAPSQFSRLDWSPDGQLIGTNSGSVRGVFTSPLIRRGEGWPIEGHLKGHRKNVNICRFNPSLKKEIIHVDGRETISCSTYLATAGGDGNIAIWKTGDKNPFFILKNVSESGISDLAWGLNGNLLLASSVDGEIAMLHFYPYTLGEFCTDKQKQDIFLSNYGEIVASEYKKNSQFTVKSLPDMSKSVLAGIRNKQINTVGTTAKKRIIPIAEPIISTELNPREFRFKYIDFKTNQLEEKLEEMKIMLPSAQRTSPLKSQISAEDASMSLPIAEKKEEFSKDIPMEEEASEIAKPLSAKRKLLNKKEEIAKVAEEQQKERDKDIQIFKKNLALLNENLHVVQDLENYWTHFNNPPQERRIRIVSNQIFCQPFTLLVANELTENTSGVIQALFQPKSTIEITLLTLSGGIIYRKEDVNNQALAVTANTDFFAIYSKKGSIQIYDTSDGSLIVPYYIKTNLVFLSSYTNGNLAFMDLSGKITVINVYEKRQLFEEPDLVKELLTQLTNEYILEKNIVREKDEQSLLYYVSLFYLQENNLYIQAANKGDSLDLNIYCLNTEMRNWERVNHLSKCIIDDENSGNIASVIPKDEAEVDGVAETTGLPISQQKREKAYFKLDKNTEELMKSIKLGIDYLENDKMEDANKREDLEALEDQLHLYERLEHKEEYFITLETYLIKCVQGAEIERLTKIIAKYDSQYKVHKKLKLDSTRYEEFFLGMQKSEILEKFIKPKIAFNAELEKKLFG
ncbi:unnamed protein product [Moneuplotes crassus]|uniref:Protein HIRA n=1 Tax=Euplotes crassus TaxID=5936 RepID=A0AAD1XZG9_EUPCR|nr:unnamed protein product [Moneuplotes crassus]